MCFLSQVPDWLWVLEQLLQQLDFLLPCYQAPGSIDLFFSHLLIYFRLRTKALNCSDISRAYICLRSANKLGYFDTLDNEDMYPVITMHVCA